MRKNGTMPGPFSVAKDAGDFYTYNIHHGFPEGLVRGYRSGFLSDMVRVELFRLIRAAYVLRQQCTSARVQLLPTSLSSSGSAAAVLM